VEDIFVEDAPELGGTRSVEYFLSGLGLEEAGDDEGLVPAQDGGLGFDVGPLLEPAVQALLLALLQVLPQAGQGASGVQLGTASRRGREE
jgi:hypothetical protein